MRNTCNPKRVSQVIVCILLSLLTIRIGFAATQSMYRHAALANVGIVAQVTEWETVFDDEFEAVSDVNCMYQWDWVPNEHWPEEEGPYPSSIWKAVNASYDGGISEGAMATNYAVTETGQSFYFAVVELLVVMRDVQTNEYFLAVASSYQATDAYQNVMEHQIYAGDWTFIYPEPDYDYDGLL